MLTRKMHITGRVQVVTYFPLLLKCLINQLYYPEINGINCGLLAISTMM